MLFVSWTLAWPLQYCSCFCCVPLLLRLMSMLLFLLDSVFLGLDFRVVCSADFCNFLSWCCCLWSLLIVCWLCFGVHLAFCFEFLLLLSCCCLAALKSSLILPTVAGLKLGVIVCFGYVYLFAWFLCCWVWVFVWSLLCSSTWHRAQRRKCQGVTQQRGFDEHPCCRMGQKAPCSLGCFACIWRQKPQNTMQKRFCWYLFIYIYIYIDLSIYIYTYMSWRTCLESMAFF